MKTIIQEGITANVIYMVDDNEHFIEIELPVLPKVGDSITIIRHGGYFDVSHIVSKVEYKIRTGDLGSTVCINIYTVPEAK